MLNTSSQSLLPPTVGAVKRADGTIHHHVDHVGHTYANSYNPRGRSETLGNIGIILTALVLITDEQCNALPCLVRPLAKRLKVFNLIRLLTLCHMS